MNESTRKLSSDIPAQYEIKVYGGLDNTWSDWFSGMILTTQCDETVGTITTLSGVIVDQAALHGILAKIYDLNLVLLSVIRDRIGV